MDTKKVGLEDGYLQDWYRTSRKARLEDGKTQGNKLESLRQNLKKPQRQPQMSACLSTCLPACLST